MMELFYSTLAVVMGILAPFIVIALLIWLLNEVNATIQAYRLAKEAEIEYAKKAPPYDNIELSQPPNPKMFSIRLIKNEKIVWEGSYDKGDYL